MTSRAELARMAAELVGLERTCVDILEKLHRKHCNRFTQHNLLNGLDDNKRSMYLESLKALVNSRVFQFDEALEIYHLTWDNEAVYELTLFLLGVVHQKNSETVSRSSLLITYPVRESELKNNIDTKTFLRAKLNKTLASFEEMAISAVNSFTIMTPFLDDVGALHVVELFRRCRENVQKNLILRFLDVSEDDRQFQEGFYPYIDFFREQNVQVYDYSLARESTWLRETFHAKVISCDNSMAYVGSANMNRYSISGSMELGVFLKGPDATTVKQLLNCVMEISKCYDCST